MDNVFLPVGVIILLRIQELLDLDFYFKFINRGKKYRIAPN